jgi:hypothetical protein
MPPTQAAVSCLAFLCSVLLQFQFALILQSGDLFLNALYFCYSVLCHVQFLLSDSGFMWYNGYRKSGSRFPQAAFAVGVSGGTY